MARRYGLLWARTMAYCYGALVAVVAFWPTAVEKALDPQIGNRIGSAKRAGAPRWFSYGSVEAVANVMLFMPLGALLALSMARAKWWLASLLGFAASVAIEVGQMLFLHNRVASFSDLVLNTVRAVLGAAIVAIARRANKTG